jgi:DNA-binding XRE family transcriptional regulator
MHKFIGFRVWIISHDTGDWVIIARKCRTTSKCSVDATGIHGIAATIGLALLRYRDSRHLTQRAMARRCGISRSRYIQIEGGRPMGIRVATLMRLAEGCETTPDGMLGFRFAEPVAA